MTEAVPLDTIKSLKLYVEATLGVHVDNNAFISVDAIILSQIWNADIIIPKMTKTV